MTDRIAGYTKSLNTFKSENSFAMMGGVIEDKDEVVLQDIDVVFRFTELEESI